MTNVDVIFSEILPKVGYFISMLYRVKIDAQMIPGAVKVDFGDDYLGHFRAGPVSGPNPVKFNLANQALLTEIGRLRVRATLKDMTSEEIIKHCAGLGEKPLLRLSSEGLTELRLEDVFYKLRRDATATSPIGFQRKPNL